MATLTELARRVAVLEAHARRRTGYSTGLRMADDPETTRTVLKAMIEAGAFMPSREAAAHPSIRGLAVALWGDEWLRAAEAAPERAAPGSERLEATGT